MDRRESLKLMLAGGMSTALVFTACKEDVSKEGTATKPVITTDEYDNYGRLPEEQERDERLMQNTFFTDEEMATITVLTDIILPKEEGSYSASEVGVPAFIEFISKDIPSHQLPLRGGLRWLDNESKSRFEKPFRELSNEQQIAIVEDIAYPFDVEPQYEQGAAFFSRMRNLTLTGFFTSKEGIEELGYKGNVPNAWDGVPEEVLQKHNLSYPEKYADVYIKPEERNEIAQWDDEGEGNS